MDQNSHSSRTSTPPSSGSSHTSPRSVETGKPRLDSAPDTPKRSPAKNLSILVPLLQYLKPHGWRISLAALALVVAAGTVLSLGSGLKFLIDEGLGSGDPGLLDQAALVMGGVVILLAGATFLRFYLVSWLGERVVADIRRDVFSHLLTLDPGFFETAKSGEVMSRLTTDTTLLQVVVGSSASIAIRNTLLLIGGMVLTYFYPITKAAHAETLLQLAERRRQTK